MSFLKVFFISMSSIKIIIFVLIVGHHLNDRHAELLFYLQIAKNQEGFKD